jgi:hypothetical protein
MQTPTSIRGKKGAARDPGLSFLFALFAVALVAIFLSVTVLRPLASVTDGVTIDPLTDFQMALPLP